MSPLIREPINTPDAPLPRWSTLILGATSLLILAVACSAYLNSPDPNPATPTLAPPLCHDVTVVNASTDTQIRRARRQTELACRRFQRHTDTPDTEIQAALRSTIITIRDPFEKGDCSNPHSSCALLLPHPPRIDVHRSHALSEDIWERRLAHEVYHVLLWGTEPTLPVADHHERMLELRLCTPPSLCGYPHRTQLPRD